MRVRRKPNSIPHINKTTQKHLENYRDRIADLPFTAKRSCTIDCITYILEGAGDGQTENS